MQSLARPLNGVAPPQRLKILARRARISFLYRLRHGRWPDLDRPQSFNEWVQWRKLKGEHRLALLCDKLYAKTLVAERCGAEYCVPTLWAGTTLPDLPPGNFPMMVKANHGCRQFKVVRGMHDWPAARRLARHWVDRTYGEWLDEHCYRAARRLVLVEPFLGDGDRLPEDYKVFVFGGRAAIIQHHVERGTRRHRWTQFDQSWTRVGGAISAAPAPVTLAAMTKAAEHLAADVDFLRVDFYEVNGRLWFGEFCLFPGSGLAPIEPVTLDRQLGRLWSEARAR